MGRTLPPAPPARRSLPPWLGPAVAAIAGLLWLAWPGADPLVALADRDVVYQIHRVSRCLGEFPWVSSVDAYAHAGEPWHLPWPGPHVLLLAIVARVAGAPAGDLVELARALSWIPPVLGAAAAAVTVLLARACGLREPLAILAGIGCALSGDAVIAFHHGAVDHHAFTALLVPLAILGWLRRSAAGWGLSVLALAATTPEAVLYVTLLLGVFGISEGWGAARAARERLPRAPVFFLLPAAAFVAAWLLDRALDPGPAPILDLSPFRLSLFQVGWLLLLGLAGAAATSLPRRGRSTAERLSALTGVALATCALLVLTLLVTQRLGDVIDRLLGPGEPAGLENLTLARALLAMPDTHWGAWTVALLVALAAWFGRLLVAVQRREPPRAVAIALLACGATAMALLEVRHARSLAAVVAVALVGATGHALAAFVHAANVRSRRWTVVVAAWLALLLVPPFAWHAVVARHELRAQPRWTRTLLPLTEWAREALPAAGPRDAQPGAAARAGAVFGPWEWGNHVNVLAQRPVVSDPFNHGDGTDTASRDAWLAETGDGFADAVTRHGASYVLTTSAAGSIYGLLAHQGSTLMHLSPQAPSGMLWLPPMRRHAAFRLDESGGMIDESGRLLPLWASPIGRVVAVADGAFTRVVTVPSVRFFEVVPGSEVSGPAPPATRLLGVETRYRIGDGEEIVATRLVPVDASGRFRFRSSVPAPWTSGTIRVTMPHVLRAAGGVAMLSLTAEGVRSGAPVELPEGTFGPPAP